MKSEEIEGINSCNNYGFVKNKIDDDEMKIDLCIHTQLHVQY